MSDLVERLRQITSADMAFYQIDAERREAAAEIERLQAKNKKNEQTFPKIAAQADNLIAENERLCGVVEKANDEIQRLEAALDRLTTQRRQDIGQLRADAERREAADEIERLRAKLDKIAKHPNTPELIRQYAADMLETKS